MFSTGRSYGEWTAYWNGGQKSINQFGTRFDADFVNMFFMVKVFVREVHDDM